MPDLLTRFIVLAGVCVLSWLFFWIARSIVEQRRQLALAAAPDPLLAPGSDPEESTHQARIRILAFSSDDCRQCHTLQDPALKRIAAAHGETVSIRHIDAPSSPELTKRYQVLTVPTTVLLDAHNQVHAVNYGFANSQRLLTQIAHMLNSSPEPLQGQESSRLEMDQLPDSAALG
jgi:thioredoxin-like negative regulator of GroEL